ncbi:hypothetical protein AYO48_01335 [Gaiella sp. SCGC AG-212-M14]|nr:hypothetical protein AYO48_01335 [Gaiella sp. SCGC AG-212-M14]
MGARNSTGLSNLSSLFKPHDATRKVFATLFAAVGDPSLTTAPKRVRKVLQKAVVRYPFGVLLGAFPALLIIVLAAVALGLDWTTSTALLLIPTIVFALLLLVVGAAFGSLGALVVDSLRALPDNYFGLCTGGDGTEGGSGPVLKRDPQPLTYWLADYLDELAGIEGDTPLTFEDLWGQRDEPNSGTQPQSLGVRLNMITTDLTAGQPRRLPFPDRKVDKQAEKLYVRESDLTAFFPERVVKHLTKAERRRELVAPPELTKKETFYSLPPAAELPVVFATRLSVSFPGLLSAFPIYVQGPHKTAEPHWFSDGGITSNFPAHFFDAPLPNWPTFGINLHAWEPDSAAPSEDECKKVGIYPHTMIAQRQIATVGSFVGAIKDTAQNWRDNGQIGIPGYRERVANIGFLRGEGGLNLYMPTDEIDRLARRGGCAGEKLRDAFYPRYGGPLGEWTQHRWRRYRVTMAVLEKWFEVMTAASNYPWACGEPDYLALHNVAGLDFPFDPGAQAAFSDKETRDLFAMVNGWGPDRPNSFQGAEEPLPELRILPRL